VNGQGRSKGGKGVPWPHAGMDGWSCKLVALAIVSVIGRKPYAVKIYA